MRSALSHLFVVTATDMPANFSKNLSLFIGGMKQSVAKKAKDIGQDFEEFRVPIPFQVYCLLCGLLFFCTR